MYFADTESKVLKYKKAFRLNEEDERLLRAEFLAEARHLTKSANATWISKGFFVVYALIRGSRDQRIQRMRRISCWNYARGNRTRMVNVRVSG